MVKKSIEDQLGLFGNSDFVAKIELGQSSFVETPAIKSGPAERLLEEVYAVVDEKILGLAANGITLNDLRDKVRNTKYLRPYYKSRRQYLLDNGKIREESVKSKIGRPVTYVYAVHPEDPPPKRRLIVPVEVIDADLVEPNPEALAPKASDLLDLTREAALSRQDRLFLDRFRNPDQRLFKKDCDSLAGKMYCRLEWVEFGMRQWLTVRQVARFLGMEERTVQKHLLEFPLEQSVLSEKLTGDRLSAYKQCYPSNPPELTNSEFVSSGGLGGLGEKAAHDFAHHFILISPAGVIWLARQSQTPEAKALNQEDMMSKEATPAAVEHVAENAAKMARDQRFTGLANSDIAFAATIEHFYEKFEELSRSQSELRDGQKAIFSLVEKNLVPTTTRTEEIVNRIDRNTNSPRKEFLPQATSGAIKAFLHITLGSGRDILDQTLLINPDGSKTKDCEFDHIRSRSVRSAENCIPLSKATHLKKTNEQLTPEEKAKFEMAAKAIENYWMQLKSLQPSQQTLPFETQP